MPHSRYRRIVSRSLEDRRKDDAFYRKCKILVTVATPFLYIKPIIANDVQFIRYPLQEELKLVRKNRQRCYGAMIQSSYLGGQLWQNDWHMYESQGSEWRYGVNFSSMYSLRLEWVST